MRIVATSVSKGSNGIPLPERTVAFETGSVTLAEAEVGDQPTVLALILSGRMHADSGTVTLDGAADPGLLQERVALVDAPGVSEPAADLSLRAVVKEELMYAGRSTSRAYIDATLAECGAAGLAGERMGDIPAAVRVRLLAELAASRPGVQGLVITSPDRHGGNPRDWLAVATELAGRDFAVAVVCGEAATEIALPLLPPAPIAADAEPAPALAELDIEA
ncbi:hypothetical protein VD659_08105 [Herbiconiux sp. 11R-BC]|uniref:hypothetical protein n=1 Tax=Herbiconiux sp. 11R-BC TaxID=3111637 RepID=UPI003C0A0891